MRLYKVFHYHLDLDHVLAVLDPSDDVEVGPDFYIGFYIVLAFQDKPMHIQLNGYSPLFKQWEKTFVMDKGIMPSFEHEHKKIEFCRAMLPELKKAHSELLLEWSGRQ